MWWNTLAIVWYAHMMTQNNSANVLPSVLCMSAMTWHVPLSNPTKLQSTILWTHTTSYASLQPLQIHVLSLQTAHQTSLARSHCTGDGEYHAAESHDLSAFSLLYIAVLAWLLFLSFMCFRWHGVSTAHALPAPPLFRLLGFLCVAVLYSLCGSLSFIALALSPSLCFWALCVNLGGWHGLLENPIFE